MYINLDLLPDTARIWVYTANKTLSQGEIEIIEKKLLDFTTHWTSHDIPVIASFKIIKNRFIIIAADESKSDISGCGIDKSLHVLQDLESSLSLTLTEKSHLVFERGEKIISIPLSKMKIAVRENIISTEDIYYNTLASSKEQLKANFRIPVKNSWVNKYFTVLT